MKQNEAQSARAKSTHKEVNQRSKDVTQIQQQRFQSPTATFTWHVCKYKVQKLIQEERERERERDRETERERERELVGGPLTQREKEREICVYVCVCV